jgi:hypothetical protein
MLIDDGAHAKAEENVVQDLHFPARQWSQDEIRRAVKQQRRLERIVRRQRSDGLPFRNISAHRLRCGVLNLLPGHHASTDAESTPPIFGDPAHQGLAVSARIDWSPTGPRRSRRIAFILSFATAAALAAAVVALLPGGGIRPRTAHSLASSQAQNRAAAALAASNPPYRPPMDAVTRRPSQLVRGHAARHRPTPRPHHTGTAGGAHQASPRHTSQNQASSTNDTAAPTQSQATSLDYTQPSQSTHSQPAPNRTPVSTSSTPPARSSGSAGSSGSASGGGGAFTLGG